MTFSDVFERAQTRSDAFGCVRTRSDAIGCIWVRLEAFGHFRKFSNEFVDFWTCFDLGGLTEPRRVGIVFSGSTFFFPVKSFKNVRRPKNVRKLRKCSIKRPKTFEPSKTSESPQRPIFFRPPPGDPEPPPRSPPRPQPWPQRRKLLRNALTFIMTGLTFWETN